VSVTYLNTSQRIPQGVGSRIQLKVAWFPDVLTTARNPHVQHPYFPFLIKAMTHMHGQNDYGLACNALFTPLLSTSTAPDADYTLVEVGHNS
jgi:hypothetical protein